MGDEIGAGTVVQWVNTLAVMLVSHMGDGSNPVFSTSDAAPC